MKIFSKFQEMLQTNRVNRQRDKIERQKDKVNRVLSYLDTPNPYEFGETIKGVYRDLESIMNKLSHDTRVYLVEQIRERESALKRSLETSRMGEIHGIIDRVNQNRETYGRKGRDTRIKILEELEETEKRAIAYELLRRKASKYNIDCGYASSGDTIDIAQDEKIAA